MNNASFLKRKGLLLVSFLLVLVYLLWAWLLPHGYFVTVDEGGKLLYIQNVLKTGDPSAPFIYPARSIDPDASFFPTYWHLQSGSEVYTWWQIGFPLLTLPFYQLFGWIGLFILPALSGGMIAYLSGKIFESEFPQFAGKSLLVAAVIGLATPILFYSANFHEHTFSIALMLAGIYSLLMAIHERKNKFWVFAGIFAALATFIRTEMVIIFFGAGLFLLIRYWRGAFRFGISFVLACVPWMLLNQTILGNPINHHLAIIADSGMFSGVGSHALKTLPMILFGQRGPVDAALIPTNTYLLFCSVFLLAALAMLLIKRLRPWASLPLAGLALTIGRVVLFSSVQYTAIHGFLEIAPFLAFALFVVVDWKKSIKSSLMGITVIAGLIFLAVYLAKAWNSAGGLQWGPRYLMAFYPLIGIIAVASFFEGLKERSHFSRIAWIGAFLIGILVAAGFQVRGFWTWNNYLQRYQAADQVLKQYQDLPIVTDYCDPPLHIADIYWNQIFLSTTRTGIQAWNDFAGQHGVDQYYAASLDVCQTIPLTQMLPEGQIGVAIEKVTVSPNP
jgi:hypothetical protein